MIRNSAIRGLRAFIFVCAIGVGAIGLGCASDGGGAATESQAAQAQAQAAPAGHPLAKVMPGMSDEQVRKIMGSPDNSNAYMTGKAWIPFYYGGDVARSDWMYKGTGRVVFSRNRYSGSLKVVRTIYDPSEDAG